MNFYKKIYCILCMYLYKYKQYNRYWIPNSCVFRISRLFSDAKKILLYSQNDKNLDGFKELAQALQVLQSSRSGRNQN